MSSMWLGPLCPACGKPTDIVMRTGGRSQPDGSVQPDVIQAGPCGCELTPEQVETLRTTQERP